jgi:hypothetical protein
MTPMIHQMNALGQRVESLTAGQQQLAGGLTHVSEAQAASQAQMLRLMESRLAEVSARMQENLQGTATRTARSLGELAATARDDRQGAGQYREAVGRRPVPAGHPVEQADARRLRRDPADRHRLEGAARGCLCAAGDAVERAAGGLPDPPAEPARPDRDRREVPARGLRGAAGGEDAVGDLGGREGLPHGGPQAHPRHRRALRDRGRDGGRGAHVPALGSRLCRASRQPRRDRARGLRRRGSGSSRPRPAWRRSTRCGRS